MVHLMVSPALSVSIMTRSFVCISLSPTNSDRDDKFSMLNHFVQ